MKEHPAPAGGGRRTGHAPVGGAGAAQLQHLVRGHRGGGVVPHQQGRDRRGGPGRSWARTRPTSSCWTTSCPASPGWTCCRPSWSASPEALVVMITAYASLETAVQATKVGAFDFLAKPFNPDELKAAVHKTAKHHMVQRAARKLAGGAPADPVRVPVGAGPRAQGAPGGGGGQPAHPAGPGPGRGAGGLRPPPGAAP